MKQGQVIPGFFNSPTGGRIEWDEVIGRIVKFIDGDTKDSYEVIIGTDSEARNGDVELVSAVILHKRGRGGIYFWAKRSLQHIHSLRQRIFEEALASLSIAQKVTDDFAAIGLFGLDLEIHVDIGPNGPTREMISEITGMIRANNFRVATKPSSWGASHVADRHV